jgi:hypothetical protein
MRLLNSFSLQSFSSGLQRRLRNRKIDGTNITQMLSSMMLWTHTRSMLDVLAKEHQAIVWPSTSLTHRMTQMMLGTDDAKEIEVFVHNVMEYIQLPFASFTEKNYAEQQFVVGASSCTSKFGFAGQDTSYLCNMDLLQGDVRCEAGRMWLKISFCNFDQTTPQAMLAASATNGGQEEIWMLVS